MTVGRWGLKPSKIHHSDTENSSREREADWRKIKLEYYKEFMAALAGNVQVLAASRCNIAALLA
jgi:hypothetical protein